MSGPVFPDFFATVNTANLAKINTHTHTHKRLETGIVLYNLQVNGNIQVSFVNYILDKYVFLNGPSKKEKEPGISLETLCSYSI